MGKPSPPYVMYVLGDDGWVERPVAQRYIGAAANLLISPRFLGEEALVSASTRQQRNNRGPADARPMIRTISKC